MEEKKYTHKELCKILDTINDKNLPLNLNQITAIKQYSASFDGILYVEHARLLIESNILLQQQLQLKDKMIFFLTKALIMQYKTQDLPFISFKIANKELEKKINEVIELVKQQALAELEE